jgi:hypothetical protein
VANDEARVLFTRAVEQDSLFAYVVSPTYNRAAFQYLTVPFGEGLQLAADYARKAVPSIQGMQMRSRN